MTMRHVLKIFIALLALIGAAEVAHANPVGNPFYKGLHNPTELATLVEASLAHDATGNYKLSGVRCGPHGSCATPMNYLRAFQNIDVTAGLTSVSQLPQYLREAKIVEGPKGSWGMYCLVPASGGKWTEKSRCLNRHFKTGEHGWVSRTGKLILAEDCTNPIDGPAQPPKQPDCVEIHFTTRPGDTAVRVAVFGPIPNDNACGPSIHRAGNSEFDEGWYDECADTTCNFADVQAIIRQPILWKASYRPTAGEHYIRLPRSYADANSPYRVVLCLDREGSHSDGIGVEPSDYVLKGTTPVATIYYNRSDVPAGAPVGYWQWGEYGH